MSTLVRSTFRVLTLLCAACTCLVTTRAVSSVWTGDELLRARVSTPSPSAGPTSTLNITIRQVGPRDYEFSRQDMETALANLNQVATQARIIPTFRDGQPWGFKLFSIRPDSLFARLGLRNGDVLHRINGLPLDSVERGLEAIQKLRETPRIELEVDRDGQPVHQTYSMR